MQESNLPIVIIDAQELINIAESMIEAFNDCFEYFRNLIGIEESKEYLEEKYIRELFICVRRTSGARAKIPAPFIERFGVMLATGTVEHTAGIQALYGC